jgi:hypothetical protein
MFSTDGALEGRATTIETSARGVAKDATILTKRVSDESKAINDRVSKLGIELKTHLCKLETKLAEISSQGAPSAAVAKQQQPVNENEQTARAITIDGIRQGEDSP